MHYRRTSFLPRDDGWCFDEMRYCARWKRNGYVDRNSAHLFRWYKQMAAQASRREARRDITEQLREEEPEMTL